MTARLRRFIGIDFSGARNAGDAIWIAAGSDSDGCLVVDHLQRARDLPGGAANRAQALAALRAYLLVQDHALVGLDFPFSLPRDLIEAANWPQFAGAFAARFPDPEAFRADCCRRSNGRELKRRTDRRARTPFAAYNLRLYRQTYWGIADILAPLAEDRRIAIAPVLERPDARCTLAEACPASTLKRLGCYRPYKGRAELHLRSRRTILERLSEERLACGHTLQDIAIADRGGDALDAIIAAATMWRVARAPGSPLACRDRIDALEARVFAWPVSPQP